MSQPEANRAMRRLGARLLVGAIIVELAPLLLHKVSVPSTASTISAFFANEGAQQNALAKTLPNSATIATHAQCVRRWRNCPMWRTLWARAIAVKLSTQLTQTNLKGVFVAQHLTLHL